MSRLDPIFVAYAKTAPLGDLRWYLPYATRKLADYDLPARAVETIGEMRQLESRLVGRDGRPADRAAVLALIARFKSAVPDWSGDPWKYGRRLDRLVRQATARGVSADAIAQLRAWFVGHLPTTADPLGRCLPRLVALPPDEIHAVLTAAEPATSQPLRAVAKTAPRALKAVPAAVPRVPIPAAAPRISCLTPGCNGALAPAADRRVTCATCAATWTLVEAGFFDRKPKDVTGGNKKPEVSRKDPTVSRKDVSGKAGVDWRAAGLKAAETRRRNIAAKAAVTIAAEQAVAA